MPINTLPPIIGDDTPRVHRTDPDTSHAAADKSSRTVPSTREHVLYLLREYGPMAAFEVNALYAAKAPRMGWPHVHYESPRKRMSELRKEGYLTDTGLRRKNAEQSLEIVVAVVEGVR